MTTDIFEAQIINEDELAVVQGGASQETIEQ